MPSGYCIYVKSFIPGLSFKAFVYSAKSEDDDVASHFVNELEEIVKQIYNEYYNFPKKINKLTAEEESLFKNATYTLLYLWM